MRNSLLLLIFLSFNSFVALAQHEADNWYFGVRAGLSFKNDTVVFIQGGQTGIRDGLTEGCAVISDKMTGDLQFYTDGETVWNRKHEVMKNGTGLLSGTSSCQGVVIVPNPGNDKLFYIFTAPDLSPVNNRIKTIKLHYTVASLENPDGEVIQKNIPLIDSIPEKMTATLDCSGTGFWVVTCHQRKSEIYSFHVTTEGVNPIPVISDYGPEAGEYGIFNTRSYFGSMKISPDRTKLAIIAASTTTPAIVLFNFNPKTGTVWGYNPLSLGKNIRECNGVAFSPDNTKLYVTGHTNIENLGSSFLFQFDVSLQTPAEIRNSLMTTQRNIGIGVIQLGPDGRIYIVNEFGALDVIEEPNKKSPAFNYKAYAINFLPKADAQQGLPNFMDYIFSKPLPGPNPIAWCMPPRPHLHMPSLFLIAVV